MRIKRRSTIDHYYSLKYDQNEKSFEAVKVMCWVTKIEEVKKMTNIYKSWSTFCKS